MTMSGWVLERGLKLAESQIISPLQGETDLQRLEKQASQIADKLDRLVQAPFEEAFCHLKEGEIVKAKDAFIRAFSNDPLNVPAKLMYALILIKLKKYDNALDVYWDIFNDFSYRADLIPELLYKAFIEKAQTLQIENNGSFEVRYGNSEFEENFYPFDFWCSSKGFVTGWKRKRKKIHIIEYNDFGINVFSWIGSRLLESKISSETLFAGLRFKKFTEIAMVTQNYFVLRYGEEYNCFSFQNGKLVQSMNEDKFTSIFLPTDRDIKLMELYQNTRFRDLNQDKNFNNVYIKIGKYTGTYTLRVITEVYDDVDYSCGTIQVSFK